VITNRIFGPVPSRRLGRSLGVDLVPFKTCTYDCIYCQLGRTTCKTTESKDRVALETVLEELSAENLLEESLMAEKLYYKVAKETPI
jgi:wyosine [tRNA(Phe)-imidazoG37] synthetase (radical SAM superfamily)